MNPGGAFKRFQALDQARSSAFKRCFQARVTLAPPPYLEAADEDERRVEVADRVRVPAQHEVAEPDVVRGGDVAPRHLGKHPLLVEVDGV